VSNTIDEYFKQVGRTELLTREQEVELSKRIEAGDERARDRMIRANLRLAISIAKQFQNKGCDLEDLIQESSLGLIKAVDRFDWRRGFKFSTYACWWIKQAARQHVASSSAPFKLPSYAKNMMYKIQQTIADYREEFGQHPSLVEIADALGTSVESVQSIMDCSSPCFSIDSSPRGDDEGKKSFGEMLPDGSEPLDSALDKQKILPVIRQALGTLTSREEKILRLRFGIYEDLDGPEFQLTDREQDDLLRSGIETGGGR
jgi:RNA polymerase primary sigma factor